MPFPCPQCGESLSVSRAYSRVIAYIALAVAGGAAYVLGARGSLLLLVCGVAYLPVFWVVVVLFYVFLPPTVERSHTSVVPRTPPVG